MQTLGFLFIYALLFAILFGLYKLAILIKERFGGGYAVLFIILVWGACNTNSNQATQEIKDDMKVHELSPSKIKRATIVLDNNFFRKRSIDVTYGKDSTGNYRVLLSHVYMTGFTFAEGKTTNLNIYLKEINDGQNVTYDLFTTTNWDYLSLFHYGKDNRYTGILRPENYGFFR